MKTRFILLVAAIFAASCSAFAIPSYDHFGELPVATFGGTGIPNDAVAVSTFTNPNGGVTVLGLTAHQRYQNPAVTNDGAGNFFAGAGGDILNGKPGYGQWNVGFYISGLASGNSVLFSFDTNAAANSGYNGSLGPITLNLQDSWNLGMAFLAGVPAFDPNAAGQYDFGLTLLDSTGATLKSASMSVNVGGGPASVPDSATTAGLIAFALCGMVVMKRRFGNNSQLALPAAA